MKKNDLIERSGKDGMPVFKGTDVPVIYLWDSIINGETIDGFLSSFPEVKKENVLNILRNAARLLENEARS